MLPLAILALLAPDREWVRQPTPGIEFRTIVQDEPKRVVYALRFLPDAPYRAGAALARDVVYDRTPNNGRATLTEMVRSADAAGGINADFFQFGDDPGGDPLNLMVRNGELLSRPEGVGGRKAAYGWGPRGYAFGVPSWQASTSLGDLVGLNEYTTAKGLTLSTPAAGDAVSKKPATFLVLNVGPRTLTPDCKIDGTVTAVVEDVERLKVNPGTMVLSTQARREALRVPLGTRVRLKVAVKGFDWRRVDNVVGGGPMLIEKGKTVAPNGSEFDKTRHPRTAVGRDAQGGTVFAVIDGRQAQSTGASLVETAEAMRRLGCVEAMNLDGGGSSSIQLFGVTLNRPSGGVERAIANAVLFHGPRPQTMSIPLRIVLGEDGRLRLVDEAERSYKPEEIVWTAQGDAWVEGDGLLHPLKTGETTVRALVEGRVYEVKLPVKL